MQQASRSIQSKSYFGTDCSRQQMRVETHATCRKWKPWHDFWVTFLLARHCNQSTLLSFDGTYHIKEEKKCVLANDLSNAETVCQGFMDQLCTNLHIHYYHSLASYGPITSHSSKSKRTIRTPHKSSSL